MSSKAKVVVITGAGQGIGRAYAHHFAQEGARVVIAERNSTSGPRVEKEITQQGGEALFVETDVADEASCTSMAQTAASRFGRIDVLVNNAAIFSTIKMKPFWDISVDEWDALMAVNVRGVWLATRAVLPYMREQQYGRIINISSGVIFIGRPMYLHYVASKGAVFAMTRAMAREVGDFGITINTITPGPTYTEVARETVTPEQKEATTRLQSIKRPEEPRDLVGAVAFLASDAASFITGQTLNVDGGLINH